MDRAWVRLLRRQTKLVTEKHRSLSVAGHEVRGAESNHLRSPLVKADDGEFRLRAALAASPERDAVARSCEEGLVHDDERAILLSLHEAR